MEEDFRDIIDTIKMDAPAIQPPHDFTPRVMAAVMEAREGVYARVWNFLSRPRKFALDPIRALRTGVNRDEMSLYFMLVAFGHLTLAVVLLMGLKNIQAGTLIPPLLRLQPWLSLFLAGWLGFWGFLLKRNTKARVKGARFATLVYIEVVVISGVLLLMEFKPILFLIPFIATVVGISVSAGIFLALSCRSEKIRNNKGSYALV